MFVKNYDYYTQSVRSVDLNYSLFIMGGVFGQPRQTPMKSGLVKEEISETGLFHRKPG